jgi:hypothetical protein
MSNEKWLKAAIIWINNIANPNEGMTHPLDDDKLKSIANAMASLNVVVDEDVIYEEGRALRICDESIEIIIDTFKKAQKRRFCTMNKFPVEFLEKKLRGIVCE